MMFMMDRTQESALPLACEAGNAQAVYTLVQRGENINQKDSKGITPLHIAAKHGHKRVIEYLLDGGADLNAQTNMGETPLHFAAMNGHEEAIRLLIMAGADGSIPDASGELPLNYAEFRGNDGIASILVSHSVKPGTKPSDLFAAIISHDLGQLTLMLSAGFSPDSPSEDGKTFPLHFALRKKRQECVPLLVKAGADLKLRSKGSQPLHIAADQGLEASIRLLIKNGAPVDETNTNTGSTPLVYACSRGYINCAAALLRAGADPLKSNFSGQTALGIALSNNGNPSNDELFQSLIASGLLKKIKPELVLDAALTAGKFGTAMMLCLLTGTQWNSLKNLDKMANREQIKCLIERENHIGIAAVEDNLAADKQGVAWEALDSL